MANEIDLHAEWIEKLQALRNHLAHVPYAARHQESLARPIAEETEAAFQADELPSGIKELWAQHRQTVNRALNSAVALADQWDVDYPILKTRPE